MKYGLITAIFLLTLPSCCLRKNHKKKTMEFPLIDETSMPMPDETIDTMTLMENEMTQKPPAE